MGTLFHKYQIRSCPMHWFIQPVKVWQERSGEHDRCSSGLYIIQQLLPVHVILLLNNVRVCWGFTQIWPSCFSNNLPLTGTLFWQILFEGDVLTQLASGYLPVIMPSGATCWLAEPVTLCFPVLSRNARLWTKLGWMGDIKDLEMSLIGRMCWR